MELKAVVAPPPLSIPSHLFFFCSWRGKQIHQPSAHTWCQKKKKLT